MCRHLHNVKKLDTVISYVVNDGIHRHRIVLQPDAVDHRYPNLKPDVTEAELLDMTHFCADRIINGRYRFSFRSGK